ncbi:hypothetical protein [Gemmatimonas sp.]
MGERDNLSLIHGEELVGVVVKGADSDGAVRYMIRGHAEMREAIMRICARAPQRETVRDHHDAAMKACDEQRWADAIEAEAMALARAMRMHTSTSTQQILARSVIGISTTIQRTIDPQLESNEALRERFAAAVSDDEFVESAVSLLDNVLSELGEPAPPQEQG